MFKLYTDGSFVNDADIAAIGVVILDDSENVIFEFFDQIKDSNIKKYHEFVALKIGLSKCLELGIKEVQSISDDINIRTIFNNDNYKQLKNEYREELKNEIFELKTKFNLISFKHVLRVNNKLANNLASKIKNDYYIHQIHNNPRSIFKNSTKILNIENLICEDDFFYNKEESNSFSKNKLKEEIDNCDNLITITVNLTDIEIKELKERTPEGLVAIEITTKDKTTKDKTYYKIEKESGKRKVISNVLEMLSEFLEKLYKDNIGNEIELNFKVNQDWLKKTDLLFRKRFELPNPKTKLTESIKKSCSLFKKVILNSVEIKF